MMAGMKKQRNGQIFGAEAWRFPAPERRPGDALPYSGHVEGAGFELLHETPMKIEVDASGGGEGVLEAEAEPETAPVAALESLPDLAAEESEPEAEPETAPAEAAFEIDLPPEIAVEEIERTLEDIGRPEPGLRGRRWSHRADAEKLISVRAPEDNTVDAGSEVRLTAEQERRRREREYLRNLRVSR